MKMNSLLLHDEFSISATTQHPKTPQLIDIVHNFEQEHPYFESFTLFYYQQLKLVTTLSRSTFI